MQLVKCATASLKFPAVNAALPLTLMSAALPCVQAHFRSGCKTGLLSHVLRIQIHDSFTLSYDLKEDIEQK